MSVPPSVAGGAIDKKRTIRKLCRALGDPLSPITLTLFRISLTVQHPCIACTRCTLPYHPTPRICHNLGWRTARVFFEKNIFRIQGENARLWRPNPPIFNGLPSFACDGTRPGHPMDHPMGHARDAHGTLFSRKRREIASTPSPTTTYRCGRCCGRPVNAARTARGRPMDDGASTLRIVT